MKKVNFLYGTLLAASVFGTAVVSSAQDILPRDNTVTDYFNSPRYRESESHPLRTLGTILHPIGWVLREAIYRPLSSFTASTDTTRSIFGYREPFDYREPSCFQNTGIPSCRDVAPFNAIYKQRELQTAEGTQGSVDAAKTEVVFPDVNFDFASSQLNELGKSRVRQVSKLLANVPSLNVVVEGHTDSKGSDQLNNKLGESRAQAVIKELSELGIDSARVTPVSFGKTKPLYTEDENWAHAANRRVQFTVKSPEVPLEATQK